MPDPRQVCSRSRLPLRMSTQQRSLEAPARPWLPTSEAAEVVLGKKPLGIRLQIPVRKRTKVFRGLFGVTVWPTEGVPLWVKGAAVSHGRGQASAVQQRASLQVRARPLDPPATWP